MVEKLSVEEYEERGNSGSMSSIKGWKDTNNKRERKAF